MVQIYTKCFLLSRTMVYHKLKIKMHQYAIFSNWRKYDTAGLLKCFTVSSCWSIHLTLNEHFCMLLKFNSFLLYFVSFLLYFEKVSMTFIYLHVFTLYRQRNLATGSAGQSHRQGVQYSVSHCASISTSGTHVWVLWYNGKETLSRYRRNRRYVTCRSMESRSVTKVLQIAEGLLVKQRNLILLVPPCEKRKLLHELFLNEPDLH